MNTFLNAWNNRTTAFKLTLICCLSTVGILVPSLAYLAQLREKLEVNRTELASMPALENMLDVVSALNQIAVAVGHAAIAATAVHNRLPPNPRR